MTRAGRARVWLALGALLAGTASASAQSAPPAPGFRPWRPVVSVGGGLTGREALGTRTITTRSASIGTLTPPPSTLFRTDATLDRGGRAEAVVSLPVTPALSVDVVGTAARRTLTTAISGDVEGAAATSASERVSEYLAGVRASLLLPWGTIGRRARPYVTAGGAYLRQLHEDNVLVETGRAWSAGAGLHVWLRGAGPRSRRALGVSTELGWQWRTGGIAFADGSRAMPTLGARVFAGF